MFGALFSINSRNSLKAYIKRSISLLESFTNQKLINHGNALHCHLRKIGLSSQKYVAVKLLLMYLDTKRPFEINQMLKEFDGFNLVVHNCLIKVNLEWGNVTKACELFDEMPDRNEVSWTCLISGLLKCGRVDEAMGYFEENPYSNVFLWTATISGLVQNKLFYEAMGLYVKMVRYGISPNDVTFTSVMRACGVFCNFRLGMGVLGLVVKTGFEDNLSVCNSLITFFVRSYQFELARMTFDRMEERDVISWTAILDMYFEMGDFTEARRIFEEMPERNEISWSAMISRLSQSGNAEEAISLFYQMVQQNFKQNVSCYSSVLTAFASMEALTSGRNIHSRVLKIGLDSNVFIGSSLIDLYCKCGITKDGHTVFDSIPDKNVVCWNSMISGYSLQGQLEEANNVFAKMPEKNNISWNSLISGHVTFEKHNEAIEIFHNMILSGEQPNKSTFSSILRACANLASLEKGKYLHTKAIKLNFHQDKFVSTALVDMYAKSGSVEDSRKIFNRMTFKNEVAWTAMIQGLAENGYAEESLTLFQEMGRNSSVKPNELILLSVLFACSHCGLVDKGLSYFNSMEKVYGINPNQRHYTGIVDMLSRSGRLCEAEHFISTMPFEPEVNAWAALLNGCKKYGDEKLAEWVAEKMSEYGEDKAGGFVLLSNIYASGGRWSDVLSTREVMSQKGVKKNGGSSWIEIRNRIHQFYSQDKSHVKSHDIYGLLQLLNSETLSQIAIADYWT